MFGCILAGQQVRTDFQIISETDLVLKLSNLAASYLTVFMTGEKPFPDGLGSVGVVFVGVFVNICFEISVGKYVINFPRSFLSKLFQQFNVS